MAVSWHEQAVVSSNSEPDAVSEPLRTIRYELYWSSTVALGESDSPFDCSRSVAQHRFKRLVVCPMHGGNFDPIDQNFPG